jgi:hypothetical protein
MPARRRRRSRSSRGNARPSRSAQRKISPAQIDALGKFAQAGGHGFGEFAYLSVSTAKALYRLHYIEVGMKPVMGGDRIRWGVVTPEGLAALNACSVASGRAPESSSLAHRPYGFQPWAVWTDAER